MPWLKGLIDFVAGEEVQLNLQKSAFFQCKATCAGTAQSLPLAWTSERAGVTFCVKGQETKVCYDGGLAKTLRQKRERAT